MARSSASRCSRLPGGPDRLPSTLILVIVGPGGVGKGTVIRRLLERDHNLWLSRSWTTRARRDGESEDAYTFVDRGSFEARVANGGFLEHAEVLGHLYGTPLPEPPPGTDVILEIDVQGARQVLDVRPDAVMVLLRAPSEEEQAARLRGRGDSEEHVARRVALGRQEVAEGTPFATAVIVNDELEPTVDRLLAIIGDARAAASRPEEPLCFSPTDEGA